MKKLLLTILLFLLLPAHSLAFSRDADSFRGIKFASDFSLVKDQMVQITKNKPTNGDNPDKKAYYRSNDTTPINGVAVEKIIYSFYKNKFYSAVFLLMGKNNCLDVTRAAITAFGVPDKKDTRNGMPTLH